MTGRQHPPAVSGLWSSRYMHTLDISKCSTATAQARMPAATVTSNPCAVVLLLSSHHTSSPAPLAANRRLGRCPGWCEAASAGPYQSTQSPSSPSASCDRDISASCFKPWCACGVPATSGFGPDICADHGAGGGWSASTVLAVNQEHSLESDCAPV